MAASPDAEPHRVCAPQPGGLASFDEQAAAKAFFGKPITFWSDKERDYVRVITLVGLSRPHRASSNTYTAISPRLNSGELASFRKQVAAEMFLAEPIIFYSDIERDYVSVSCLICVRSQPCYSSLMHHECQLRPVTVFENG